MYLHYSYLTTVAKYICITYAHCMYFVTAFCTMCDQNNIDRCLCYWYSTGYLRRENFLGCKFCGDTYNVPVLFNNYDVSVTQSSLAPPHTREFCQLQHRTCRSPDRVSLVLYNCLIICGNLLPFHLI